MNNIDISAEGYNIKKLKMIVITLRIIRIAVDIVITIMTVVHKIPRMQIK